MTSRRRRVTERRRLRRWRWLRQRRHFSLRRQRLRGCCSSQHPWRGHFSPILAEWRELQPLLQQFEFQFFRSLRTGRAEEKRKTPPPVPERRRAPPHACRSFSRRRPSRASEPRGGRARRRGWLPEGGQTAGLPRPRAGFRRHRRHGPGTALGLEPGTEGCLPPRTSSPIRKRRSRPRRSAFFLRVAAREQPRDPARRARAGQNRPSRRRHRLLRPALHPQPGLLTAPSAGLD